MFVNGLEATYLHRGADNHLFHIEAP